MASSLPTRSRLTLVREDSVNERALVEGALAGDAHAMRELVSFLRPFVQAEVAWTLRRFAPKGRNRDPRQETADMVQEVFLALFDHRGRILSAWDPSRGRTLASFVKLIARHQVVSVLRSNRRCPWTEDPTLLERMQLETDESPETALLEAQSAQRLVEALREHLSTRSMYLFEELYVEERSVEDVCSDAGMTRDALYAWRARIKRQLKTIALKLGIGGER